MQLTDELRVIVNAEIEKALQGFKKLNNETDKNTSSLKKLSDALDKIDGKMMIASAALTGAGVAAIKMAGNLEQTQLALEVLLKDAEAATKIKDEWVELAAATPFSSSDIDSAGKKLLAFNIEAEKVTDTLRRIGDISAATGSSIAEIADIYGKAKVQGRLFAEDINQFQGRGIPVVQALAKTLGVAETEVRNLVTEGKVGFPELEKAFKQLTDNGGQFAGMMDKLSQSTLGKFSTLMDDAQLALASFGELLLPTANDVMDAAGDVLEKITDLDDGTKRFILTFGGVVAAAGPVALSIKAISGAMAVLAANPIIMGVAGITVGIGLIAGAVNKYKHQFEDTTKEIRENNAETQRLLDAYADGDIAKRLDAETTQKLILLYPELTGKITAYATSVEDAAKAVTELNEQKTIEAAEERIKKLEKERDRLIRFKQEYAAAKAELQPQIDLNKASGLETGYLETILEDDVKGIQKQQALVDKLKAEINATLASIGKTLGVTWDVIDLPPVAVDITPKVDEVETEVVLKEATKTWQAWWEEITGISQDSFSTGAEAGSLYVKGLEKALSESKNIADALGKNFDMSGFLQKQMSEVENDINKLLSIPVSEIDEQYQLWDSSIQALIDKYKELAEAKEKAEKTDGDDDAEKAEKLKESIKEIGKSLGELALSGTLDGFAEFGKALAEGKNAADSLKDALGSMAQQILNQLPTMFLQAGLQLIAQGQWALGLGFIAAAGVSSFTSGYVEGKLSAEENAKGGVYGTVTPFAKGGSFTNTIIDSPTNFKFAKGSGFGLGLMGEAGPEAIMPLKRSADGSLGVDASGVNAGVQLQMAIVINNYSSEEVSAKETQKEDGQRQLEIIIGSKINQHIASGKADTAMKNRYGVKPAGV